MGIVDNLRRRAESEIEHSIWQGAKKAGSKLAKGSCPKCKKLLPQSAKFCPSCGAPLGSNCSKCGAAIAKGANFCTGCGAKIR